MDDAITKELMEKYRLVVEVYQAMSDEYGQDAALKVIASAWINYGKQNMANRAEELGDNSLEALGATFTNYQGKEVDVTVDEASAEKVAIRITRCGHYDAFKELGAPEVCVKYCESDYEACKSFNPDIKMIRDKILPDGDDHCNHTWVMDR